MNRLLQQYADGLVLGDKERRLLGEYQAVSREWIADAKQAMSLVDDGRAAEAIDLLNGPVSALGSVSAPCRTSGSRTTRKRRRPLARNPSRSSTGFGGTCSSRTRLPCSLALLGFLTFRRIVTPIQALGNVGHDHCRRRLREGRPLRQCDGRNRRPCALD